MSFTFFFLCSGVHLDLHSFPTRRSSDLDSQPRLPHLLVGRNRAVRREGVRARRVGHGLPDERREEHLTRRARDRKSTRLNSSHPSISYAVFCLKKKKYKL